MLAVATWRDYSGYFNITCSNLHLTIIAFSFRPLSECFCYARPRVRSALICGLYIHDCDLGDCKKAVRGRRIYCKLWPTRKAHSLLQFYYLLLIGTVQPWLSMVAALSMNFVTSYASFESTALSAPKSRPFVELYKDKPDKTKDAEAEKIVPNKIAPHPRSTEKGAAKGDISKKSVSKDGVREKSTSGPAPAKKLATPGIPSMSRAVVPKISSDPTPVDNSTAQLENKGSTKSVHKKLIPSHGAAGVATAKRIASKTPTSRVAAIERAGEKISTETAALKRTSKRARPNNPPATALDIPTAAASHEKQFTPGMNSQRRSKRERHTLRPEP